MTKSLVLALALSACAGASSPTPGPQGEPGAMGEMGTPGTPGVTGQACWDLNNNGTCDQATEDTNDDNTCDVGDCIGPQGPQGPAGPNGPSGTAGQLGQGLFGTASLAVTGTSTTFALIPGLTTTVEIPANAIVMISTDGGVATTSTVATGFSQIDVVILIDGALPAQGGYKRVIAANTTGLTGVFAPWSMSVVTPLAAGAHTIQVQAGGTGAGANATVSGDVNSVNQGSLSVLVLKQ